MENSTSTSHFSKVMGIENAPHLRGLLSTPKLMGLVMLALLPAFIAEIYFFGKAVLWQFLICAVTAVICQALASKLRRRPLFSSVSDLSGLVTAMIMAMALPPLMPAYFTVSGVVFAVLIVKECFGGLGQNIFNPAMAGFVFLVISAPGTFGISWLVPAPQAYVKADFSSTAAVIFGHADPLELRHRVEALNIKNTEILLGGGYVMTGASRSSMADGLTGATRLEIVKGSRKEQSADRLPAVDFTESCYLAYLIMGISYLAGGILLLALKIINFRMTLAFLISFALFAAAGHALMPGNFIPLEDQFLFGGTMMAAFFIITDPVTNAGTAKGRIFFAIFVAFLIVLIRAFGSYSDAVAFAVLLGNAAAPLIDVLTRRKPFGAGYKKGGLS